MITVRMEDTDSMSSPSLTYKLRDRCNSITFLGRISNSRRAGKTLFHNYAVRQGELPVETAFLE